MNLPTVRDPIILALMVMLGVVTLAMGVQWWVLRGARAELETTAASLKMAEAALAVSRAQHADAVATNQSMTRSMDAQSRSIERLRDSARTIEAKAGAAARVVLAERPKLPEGHGPAEMNSWLRESYGVP